MDNQFGAGTSAVTSCLKVRKGIKVAVNLSTSVLNPKSGISQTINNVNNMVENYEEMHGMPLSEDYRIAIVMHFAGGRFWLTDAANGTYNVTIRRARR